MENFWMTILRHRSRTFSVSRYHARRSLWCTVSGSLSSHRRRTWRQMWWRHCRPKWWRHTCTAGYCRCLMRPRRVPTSRHTCLTWLLSVLDEAETSSYVTTHLSHLATVGAWWDRDELLCHDTPVSPGPASGQNTWQAAPVRRRRTVNRVPAWEWTTTRLGWCPVQSRQSRSLIEWWNRSRSQRGHPSHAPRVQTTELRVERIRWVAVNWRTAVHGRRSCPLYRKWTACACALWHPPSDDAVFDVLSKMSSDLMSYWRHCCRTHCHNQTLQPSISANIHHSLLVWYYWLDKIQYMISSLQFAVSVHSRLHLLATGCTTEVKLFEIVEYN